MVRSVLAARRLLTRSPRRRRGGERFSVAGASASTTTEFFCCNEHQQERFSSSSSLSSKPALDKVLIANRGEIACRVIRTCQRLGIPTVALYSVADGPHALHARMADEAVLIGNGPTPSESYLLQEEVLQICHETGAQAIHPGYGFLSENADFCQRVSDEGLIFIGPPADAITSMGSKSKSKAIMEAAGVPTTPGYYGDDTQEPEVLLAEANKVGYPLLIKAVSGGGGKGMRLVWNESEFLDNLASCQREAQSSFGDKRVLLERYLVSPRHVEVQIVADQFGNVVHLFERDCSLQRRHQKIIEEAPASDLPLDFREEIGEMGKRAAQAVGYVNAGTVEFLLDTQGPEPNTPMFCEMNTRLQVEHPITELISGVDLVEWQLRIAAGEELPKKQSEIKCSGHAFEARIYAENPARNFLPATGTVWHHQPPAELNVGVNEDGVRVDTGIEAGSEVGVYYDPMICKLIAYDETRDKALEKLVSSLKNYQIAGVPTNIEFLVNCAEHPTFQEAGAMNTGFLDNQLEEVQVLEDKVPSSLASAVGAFSMLLRLEGRHQVQNLLQERRRRSPWSSLAGSWTMGARAKRTLRLQDGTEMECFSNRDGSFDISWNGETTHIQGSFTNDQTMSVVINGRKRLELTSVLKESDGIFEVRMWPKGSHGQQEFCWEVDLENPLKPPLNLSSQAVGTEGSVKAPMPGKVSRINVSPGDEVKEGDVLLAMEAMKMEHSIKSPISGVVVELRCQVDDIVKDSFVLATVVAGEDDRDQTSQAA